MRFALLVVLVLTLSGCTGVSLPCREGTPAEGERGVCFVSDQWILRGGTRGREGPVVLLVHGAGEDRRDLDNLSRALAANGTRVLSFDLRAHGESKRVGDELDPATFTGEQWRAMVVDLQAAAARAERRWDAYPTVVVGSGVGGSLALLHAVEHDVSKLVLLSPGLRTKDLDVLQPAAAFDGRALLVAGARDAGGAESAALLEVRMANATVESLNPPGGATGARLLDDPRVLESVIRFATS